MTAKLNIFIAIGVGFFLLTWLFVGAFRDDEFHEPHIFAKHKPTFKVTFYSPIGMQSLNIKELSVDKQSEEIAFQEFVVKRYQQNNRNAPLWYFPFILIQITFSFLTLGIYGRTRQIQFRIRHLGLHFLFDIIPTSLIIVFILSLDKIYLIFFLSTLLIVLNFLIAVVLARSNRLMVSYDKLG